jgi:hypothetical protein
MEHQNRIEELWTKKELYKKELYNQFISGEKKLNFKDICTLANEYTLLEIEDAISSTCIDSVEEIKDSKNVKVHYKDITNSQAITEMASICPYHNVFEEIDEMIFNGQFDECFFSDIKTNQEIIKVICTRIESSIFFEDSLIENLEHDFLKNKVDWDYLLGYYLKKAQYLIQTFKDYFVPDLHIRYPLSKEESIIRKQSDKRKNIYSPTNNEKLKSLCVFCPELISKLHKLSKKDKQEIIFLITGVNKADAYKNVFTSKKRILDETTIKNDEIDFEDLKNKLKNT